MRNNWLLFIDSGDDFFHMDPLLPHSYGGHWLFHITSFIDNSRYLYVPGSLALQEALNRVTKFAGAVVLWFASGSNSRFNGKIPGVGSHSHFSGTSTQVKSTSSTRCDLMWPFWKSKCKRESANQNLFGKISSFALKQFFDEAGHLQSFPVLSLAAALVPPLTNHSWNAGAVPMETGSIEARKSMDQRPCEIENRGCGPCSELYFQNLPWSKTAVEPKTGIEFPIMLENSESGESNSSFSTEVLVGTGSRTITVIRIKSLEVYAFGFYVHPFDVCEKLGSKYNNIPEYELNKQQDFYRDLLREDINMTVRLVVSCNGIKINTVKDAFEKSLRGRLTRMNPDSDFRCLQTFGSMFTQNIPLHVGTTIDFHRTSDGHLITEVGGNHVGAVESKELCRAFFDMYIGDFPLCEKTKEAIGKNVASIIRMC